MQLSSEIVHFQPLLAYIGPDQILPLSSALAAITGVLLLFWQRVKLFFQKLVGLLSRKRA